MTVLQLGIAVFLIGVFLVAMAAIATRICHWIVEDAVRSALDRYEAWFEQDTPPAWGGEEVFAALRSGDVHAEVIDQAYINREFDAMTARHRPALTARIRARRLDRRARRTNHPEGNR